MGVGGVSMLKQCIEQTEVIAQYKSSSVSIVMSNGYCYCEKLDIGLNSSL